MNMLCKIKQKIETDKIIIIFFHLIIVTIIKSTMPFIPMRLRTKEFQYEAWPTEVLIKCLILYTFV